MSDRFSRRTLLRGLGVSPAFLPLLTEDHAQGAVAEPKRLMILQWTNGVVPDKFFPKGTETNLRCLNAPSLWPRIKPTRFSCHLT